MKLLSLLLLSFSANAVELEPYLTYGHGSDFFKGQPWNKRDEWSYDHAGVGATITWRKIEIDVSHGVKSYAGREAESGTHAAIKWYFRR